MSPPGALHRSGERALALSPSFKVFLSGSILFLGIAGALPFYQPIRMSSTPPTAPLSADGTATLNTLSDKAAPTIAVQAEKYAKSYPEPLLVSESLPPNTAPKPLASDGKPTIKPISATVRDFAAVRQFTPPPATTVDRQTTTFDKQPDCIDPSKVADSLLPMFHFAENLKPPSAETDAKTPPQNPFPQPTATQKLLPLRPYTELRPLRLLDSRPSNIVTVQ